jgi:hypothetical protein
MMGGEGLAALKYASGSLSLLNIAEELPIPQLTHLDLHNLFGQQYPQLNLSPAQLQSVLDFTGCHPRLLPYCLQQGADSAQACAQCYDNRLYLPNCSRVSMTRGIVCYSVPCWRKRYSGGLLSGQTMNYYAGYTGPI